MRLIVLFIVLAAAPSLSKATAVGLKRVVTNAQMIFVGTVTSVDDGVATITVESSIKGDPGQTVRVHAMPRWMCDDTKLVVKKRYLLATWNDLRHARSDTQVVLYSGAGQIELIGDLARPNNALLLTDDFPVVVATDDDGSEIPLVSADALLERFRACVEGADICRDGHDSMYGLLARQR